MIKRCLAWMKISRQNRHLSRKTIERIRKIYTEYQLYPDDIPREEWFCADTVERMQVLIKSHARDPYTKFFSVEKSGCSPSNECVDYMNETVYVAFRDFEKTEEILKFLSTRTVNHLILDLAGNWGGSIQKMLDFASYFSLSKGEVLLKYRNEEKRYKLKDQSKHRIANLTIFTDRHTMSSAEILLFLLRDGHDNCRIIGERTTQKAFGQVTYLDKRNHCALSVTAFRWYVNGQTSEMLQEKYKNEFLKAQYKKEQYLEEAFLRYILA